MELLKDLNRRTAADKVLHDKALNIANQWIIRINYRYQPEFASKVYIFYIYSLYQTNNYAKKLLENPRKEMYTHLL